MRTIARYSAVIIATALIFRAFAQIPEPPKQLDSWYAFLLEWVFRPGFAAIAVGIFMAFIVPQRVKMDFPHTWEPERRRRTTRRVSFISGFIPTALLWPIGWMTDFMTVRDIYLVWVTGLLSAIAVGAAAPFSYTIIMNRLYKMGWAIPEKWSGERVAELKREGTIPLEAKSGVDAAGQPIIGPEPVVQADSAKSNNGG